MVGLLASRTHNTSPKMSYKGKVFLVCTSQQTMQSGKDFHVDRYIIDLLGNIRSLAAQGADIALLVPSDCSTGDVLALRTEIPQLTGAGKITIHREGALSSTSFQQCVTEVLRTHGRLDFVVDLDGQVTAQNAQGDEDDKTQLLVYTAVTSMQARRLRQLYGQSRV